MIRATHVHGQYRWAEAAADTVVLDFDDRHRRRMAMTGTRGLDFCSISKTPSRCAAAMRWCWKTAA